MAVRLEAQEGGRPRPERKDRKMTAQGKITSSRLQVGTVLLTEDGYPTARKGRQTTQMEVTKLERVNPEGRGRRVRIQVTLTSLDGTEERVASVSPSQTW